MADEFDEGFDGMRIFGSDDDEENETRPHSVFDEPVWGEEEPEVEWTAPPGAATDAGGEDLDDWSGLSGDDELRWADDDQYDAFGPTTEDDDDFFAYDDSQPKPAVPESGVVDEPVPIRAGTAPGAAMPAPPGPGSGGDRNMPMAIATGAGLAAVALVSFVVGPALTIILVTVLLGLAAVEYTNSLRVAGYAPPTLLILVSVVSMSLAAYYRGEVGIAVTLFLTVVFAALWYLTGVDDHQPLLNIGVGLLGVVWIGVMGAFAGVMLFWEDDTGLVAAAVIATVGYDIGGLFIGKAMGRQPLSPASPNKTVEGLVGGCLASIAASIVLIGIVPKIAPLGENPGGLSDVLVFGLVAAVVAPIGDLFQSLLKRDLGIKDMGSILPGHGGFLDRFDAMLFVLPTTYYVARVVL